MAIVATYGAIIKPGLRAQGYWRGAFGGGLAVAGGFVLVAGAVVLAPASEV